MLAHRGQLIFQAHDSAIRVRRAPRTRLGSLGGLEQNQEMMFLPRATLQRDYLQIDIAELSFIVDPQMISSDRDPFRLRLVNIPAQLNQQALMGQLQQVTGGAAGLLTKIWLGVATKLQDFHLLVDQNAGRAVAPEEELVGLFPRLKSAL